MRIPSLCVALLCVLASGVQAQIERYELGHRLRALERVAATRAEPAQRAAIASEIQRALNGFFSLNLREAARGIDGARLRLLHGESPPPHAQRAATLMVSVPAQLIEASVEPSARNDEPMPDDYVLTVDEMYRVDDAADDEAEGVEAPPQFVAWFAGTPRGAPLELAETPAEYRVSIRGIAPGDHELCWEIRRGDDVYETRSRIVSIASDVEARTQRLVERTRKPAGSREVADALETERRTARALARTCRALASSRQQETDYPGNRLLAEAESLLQHLDAAAAAADADDPQRFYRAPQTGEFWLELGTREGPVACRILVPERAVDAPAPALVLALHGVGGSENLFFDGEDGLLPRLCAARGWLCVATRASPVSDPRPVAVLDELASRYVFDPQRVFVIGHSMGAMQAVGAVVAAPDRFAALVALGGGGMIRSKTKLPGLRCFIGVGSRDFALAGARALQRAALAAGVAEVEWREYQEVGHVLILQDAIPDVFEWLDR